MTSSDLNVNEVIGNLHRFSTSDYVVFVAMLVMCLAIGIYFGFKDHAMKKTARTIQTQNESASERRGSEEINYLMGGRNMKVFPVAMSLVASGLSGITLLGFPSEVYIFGINIIYILLPIIILGFFVHYVIVPIFFELQIVSTYEYLKKRFDNRVRLFGSLLFLLTNILWLPIVIYVPALSFNQATGINIHIISVFVCLVCIVYTLVGGIKAVIWTDVIQIMLMYGSLIIIVITGIRDVGGIGVVIERNMNSSRFQTPNFTFDLTERHSALSLMIGGTTFMINLFGMNQAMIQRYLSLPSVKAAKHALLWNIGGVIVMISLCCMSGLILYAKFHDCDPLTTKLVKAKDQMLPLMVLEVLSDIPGFCGLFIAGVFSASLSSLSTALNSAAAVVLEDFYKPNVKTELSEAKTAFIMRATVFIFGAISVLLVSVVQRLGGVLQLGMSLTAASLGPLFGLFFMGFFFPWIKSKGAMVGAHVALVVILYIAIRAQAAQTSGELVHDTKPLSTDGCDYTFKPHQNLTIVHEYPITEQFLPDDSFQLHHISYMFFSALGTVLTVLIAFIVTYFDNDLNPTTIDPRLLAPFMRNYFQSKARRGDCEMVEVEHKFDEKDNKIISDY